MQAQELQDADPEDDEETASPAQGTAKSLVPRLEYDAAGNVTANEESLIVQAQPQKEIKGASNYENVINNMSHTNRVKSSKWSAKETDHFFKVRDPLKLLCLQVASAALIARWLGC